MSEPLKKFQVLLRELFQFDSADLDFGLYRIMNHKRSVVERFIERDLPQAVRHALEKGALKDQSEQKAALEELAGRIRKDFSDDAISPDGVLAPQHARTNLGKDYLKLQAALGSVEVSESAEAEIYNRLYDFFSRYYEDGDFIALRRYGSRSHYAIPYNGEEVVLHWANKDQYYIKTGERFRDYRFRAGDGKEAWSVEFKLVSAETETDNKKASSKRFFLFDVANLELDERRRTLVVPVAYRALGADEERALGNRQQQDKVNVQAEEKILRSRRVQAHAPLVAALEHNVSEDDAKPRSLLARHLTRFTRRNTSDYFIHKDLGAFLTRELDFYLKAEALDLDTLLRGGGGKAGSSVAREARLPSRHRRANYHLPRTVRKLREEALRETQVHHRVPLVLDPRPC